MPTTARVTIAALDDTKIVTETVNHVWNTAAARHLAVKLVKEVQQTIAWPANCNFVYGVAIPQTAGGTLVVSSAAADPGWVMTLVLLVRTPFLMQKPATGNLVLQAHTNDVDPVDLFFF